VLRGGSWIGIPRFVRVSGRLGLRPGGRSYNFGFGVWGMTFPLFLLLFHFNFATSRDTSGGGEATEDFGYFLPHDSRRGSRAVADVFARLGADANECEARLDDDAIVAAGVTEAQQAVKCPQPGPLSVAQLTDLLKSPVPKRGSGNSSSVAASTSEPAEIDRPSAFAGAPESVLVAVLSAGGSATREAPRRAGSKKVNPTDGLTYVWIRRGRS